LSSETSTLIDLDEVMAIAASYDQTLRYGAQTPFSDQLTFHWKPGETGGKPGTETGKPGTDGTFSGFQAGWRTASFEV